jgi:hypothetical protein
MCVTFLLFKTGSRPCAKTIELLRVRVRMRARVLSSRPYLPSTALRHRSVLDGGRGPRSAGCAAARLRVRRSIRGPGTIATRLRVVRGVLSRLCEEYGPLQPLRKRGTKSES